MVGGVDYVDIVIFSDIGKYGFGNIYVFKFECIQDVNDFGFLWFDWVDSCKCGINGFMVIFVVGRYSYGFWIRRCGGVYVGWLGINFIYQVFGSEVGVVDGSGVVFGFWSQVFYEYVYNIWFG